MSIRARFFQHDDNRRVSVARWMIEVTRDDDGSANYGAALMIAQLTWWLEPDGRSGRVRADHEHLGETWLVRSDEGWGDELGMTDRMARRMRHRLMKLGLIECRQMVDGGVKCTHIRRLPIAVEEPEEDEAIRPKVANGDRPKVADVIRPETANVETVLAGSHAGASSPVSGDVVGDSPTLRDRAVAIVDPWWEERRAAGHPVAQRYVAVVSVVQQVLGQGIGDADVAAVLPHVPVVSSGAIEMALNKSRPRPTQAASALDEYRARRAR